jgi:NDP-sugar pyrophosphorylase family protein
MPKPIVPFANRPFVLYQIEMLERSGITDITLSLNYQPDKIVDILGDGGNYGVRLTYVTEPAPMGTGGAYKFAFQNESESAIVLNGDILTDVDVAKIVSRHVESSADATIALTPVPDPSRYGLVETAADGRISRFLEKPDAAEVENLGTNLINAGIYILEPSMLKMVKGVENASFEYEVFPKALDSGLHLNSFSLNDSYWRDIGTPESYIEAHMDLLGGKIPGFNIDRSKTDRGDCEAVDGEWVGAVGWGV